MPKEEACIAPPSALKKSCTPRKRRSHSGMTPLATKRKLLGSLGLAKAILEVSILKYVRGIEMLGLMLPIKGKAMADEAL